MLRQEQEKAAMAERKARELQEKFLSTQEMNNHLLQKIQDLENTSRSVNLDENQMRSDPAIQIFVKKCVEEAKNAEKVEIRRLMEQNSFISDENIALVSKLAAETGTVSSLSNHLTELTGEMVQYKRDLQLSNGKIAEKDSRIKELEGNIEEFKLEIERLRSESTGSGEGLSEEVLRDLMQNIYMKACEIFISEDDSISFTSKEVVKKLKNVLKSVTSDRTG